MNKYSYKGPVMRYDRCVEDNWKAETVAPSLAKARSNFMYQWKQENGYIQRIKIELPGKITLIG